MVSGAYVSLKIPLVLNSNSKYSSKHDKLDENSQIWISIKLLLSLRYFLESELVLLASPEAK